MADDVRHVSETALFAAGCRAMESERADALIHDPLAAGLAGEHGLRIARTLPDGAWVVAIRTVVIDAYVRASISGGVDTVVNVGAGMDTRPYRMDLPSSLRWIEIDDPRVIERKAEQLRDQTPRCSVERFGVDLADHDARRELFRAFGGSPARSIALTEGVVGYLGTDEVGGLASDLRTVAGCDLWVTEYLSRRMLRSYRKHQPFRGAPVRFDPGDWEAFFIRRGWMVRQIRYMGEESRRLHRPVPLTAADKVMRLFTSRPLRDMGYALLERVDP